MKKNQKEMTAAWLKEGRVSKGLTQKELSEQSNISIRSIQRIENGEIIPRTHTLKTLAHILGLSFEEFMKAAHENQFSIPQGEASSLTRPQRIVLSIGVGSVILLLTWAFAAQSPNFPETTFELLIFVSIAFALITMVLFLVWRKNA